MHDYEELRIRIWKTGRNRYLVFANGLDAAASHVRLPRSPQDYRRALDALLEEEFQDRQPDSQQTTRERVQALGRELFDVFLPERVGECLRESLRLAQKQDKRLRVRIDAPDLMDIPFEILCSHASDPLGELALHHEISVVRSLQGLPKNSLRLPQPSGMREHIKLFVIVSCPRGQEPLAAQREIDRINRALPPFLKEIRQESPLLQTLGRLNSSGEPATRDNISKLLRRQDEPCAVLIIAHGEYDPKQKESFVLLEKEDGSVDPVPGWILKGLIAESAALRLVVLNLCVGAKSIPGEPFSGMAQALVAEGIPAVVAMQTEVSDEAASCFSPPLFRAICDNLTIDEAVTAGRLRMANCGPTRIEWCTPVVFMHEDCGQGWLFKLPAPRPKGKKLPDPLLDGQRILERVANDSSLDNIFQAACFLKKSRKWMRVRNLAESLLTAQSIDPVHERLFLEAAAELHFSALQKICSWLVREEDPGEAETLSESLQEARLRAGFFSIIAEEVERARSLWTLYCQASIKENLAKDAEDWRHIMGLYDQLLHKSPEGYRDAASRRKAAAEALRDEAWKPVVESLRGVPEEHQNGEAGRMRSYAQGRLAEARSVPEVVKTRFTPLPAPPRCLGRYRELEELVSSICREPPPPAPILGPPGAGRTTLALAALHDVRVVQRFGERRWYVRCDGVESRGELAAKIARGLGLVDDASQEARLVIELQLGPAVLVLDDAEVPWEVDPIAVEELFSRLAAVKTLALVVALRGEQRPRGTAWRDAIRLGPLELAVARDAFLAVAGESFRQDPHLDRLLDAADRLPLALALLAYQAEGQPDLADLWQAWQSRRIAILRRGEAASLLDVSLALAIGSPRMTAGTRRLLSILSALPDGVARCDLDALLPGQAREAAATLRRVGLAFDQGNRLRLLNPIREHVLSELPPVAEDLDRAVDHFLDLALRREGAGRDDANNLEAMVLRGLARSNVEPAARAALAVIDVLRLAGLDASHLLGESCRACRESGLVGETAACLQKLGDLALERGEPETAQGCFEEAGTLYRQFGDKVGQGQCFKALGEVALAGGESASETARVYFQRAICLYRDGEDLQAVAQCLEDLGHLDMRSSGYGFARDLYQQALPLYHEEDPLSEAVCRKTLGDIFLLEGLAFDAGAQYREALRLFQGIGHAFCEALCLRSLGDIALTQADLQTARARYEQALALYEHLDLLAGRACCLRKLGDVAVASRDSGTARARYQEALALYRDCTFPSRGAAWCARRLGDIALAERAYTAAYEHYEEALLLYQRTSNIPGEVYCLTRFSEIVATQFGALPEAPEPADAHSFVRALAIGRFQALGNLERAAHFQISAGTPSEEARFDDLLADASKGERKALALLADANEVPLFASSEAAALWKMLLWAPIQFQLNPMLVLRNLQSLLEEAQARQDLGRAALDRGDYDSASDLYWEASVLFRRLGYLLGEAECLRRLGDVALRRGSSGTAQLRYEEALVRYRSAGGRRGQVYCFEMLGRIAREQSAVLQLDQ